MHDFKQSITASLGLNLFILKDIIEKHIYELWYTIEYHVCTVCMHACMVTRNLVQASGTFIYVHNWLGFSDQVLFFQ